jgi:hypothetical protein
MVGLTLVWLVRQRALWRLLAHNSQEQGTPADHGRLFAQRGGEVKLRLDQPALVTIKLAFSRIWHACTPSALF